jgi:predicted RNA methylase
VDGGPIQEHDRLAVADLAVHDHRERSVLDLGATTAILSDAPDDAFDELRRAAPAIVKCA